METATRLIAMGTVLCKMPLRTTIRMEFGLIKGAEELLTACSDILLSHDFKEPYQEASRARGRVTDYIPFFWCDHPYHKLYN
jgi:hypothetical protein